MNKITEAELEIMKVLWENKEATSLQIIDEVSKTTDWNKNTIKTLISRLVEKEVISVDKNKGNLYLYTPNISIEEYKSEENKNFLKKLYNGSVNDMLLTFAKSNELTRKDLEELMKLIDSEEE